MVSIDVDRIYKVRKSMEENKIDVLILRLSENVLFLSGYWPLNGFSFIVFFIEKDPVLIIPEGEKKYAENSWVKDIRLFGWGKVYDENPYTSISNNLRELLNKNARNKYRIGYEGSFETVAPAHMAGEVMVPSQITLNMLNSTLLNAEFIDATPMINKLRATKTRREIEKIKLANEIACFGLQEFLVGCEDGIKEAELESRVYSMIHTMGVGYKGAVSVCCWPNIMSGKRTSFAHRPYLISEDKFLKKGDLVVLELATVVDGYWSDLTRTKVVGKANKRQLEIFNVVEKAQDSAIKKIKPKVLERDVDKEAREFIKSNGYEDYFVHHTGHGIGFKYHEPYPFLHPEAVGVLQEGMVTTVEPGVYIEDFGGIRIEDDILVTSEGFEYLSEFKCSLD
ncbi:MAG: aminopeptidase P family protein [Actinobacteria bacterium]|nr:aminopeptidase P family protein [Actinomycetota bacterium]